MRGLPQWIRAAHVKARLKAALHVTRKAFSRFIRTIAIRPGPGSVSSLARARARAGPRAGRRGRSPVRLVQTALSGSGCAPSFPPRRTAQSCAFTTHSHAVPLPECVAQPMLGISVQARTTCRATATVSTTQSRPIMNPRHYVDLKDSSRELQPTYYFMINCLLYSRMETGLVSNQDFYDEDVNVYLAHLLHSFINPEYVEQSKKFLSKYDTDVFRRLSNSTASRLKYLIYKPNAYFLLVSIGIFDNPMVPAANRRSQPSEEAYVGRGKTYYHFAY